MSIRDSIPLPKNPASQLQGLPRCTLARQVQPTGPKTRIRVTREVGGEFSGEMSPTYEAPETLALGLAILAPQQFTPPSKAQITGRMAATKAGEGQR